MIRGRLDPAGPLSQESSGNTCAEIRPVSILSPQTAPKTTKTGTKRPTAADGRPQNQRVDSDRARKTKLPPFYRRLGVSPRPLALVLGLAVPRLHRSLVLFGHRFQEKKGVQKALAPERDGKPEHSGNRDFHPLPREGLQTLKPSAVSRPQNNRSHLAPPVASMKATAADRPVWPQYRIPNQSTSTRKHCRASREGPNDWVLSCRPCELWCQNQSGTTQNAQGPHRRHRSAMDPWCQPEPRIPTRLRWANDRPSRHKTTQPHSSLHLPLALSTMVNLLC